MMKYTIPALAAALAMGACAEADAPAADGDGTDTTVVTPATTETVVTERVVEEGAEGSSVTIDGGDVDATIGEDGVQAEIDLDGN